MHSLLEFTLVGDWRCAKARPASIAVTLAAMAAATLSAIEVCAATACDFFGNPSSLK